MDGRLCEWQRKVKLIQRLVNQLNYHPDENRVKEIQRQIKTILEYLAEDIGFITERR